MVNIRQARLIDLLPDSIRNDKQVKAAAEALDRELQAATSAIDRTMLLPILDELPESVVDLLAWQWHVDFYDPSLDIAKKRKLVRQSVSWHRIKGTKAAVEAVVSASFEPSKVLEWFEYGGEPFHFKIVTEDATTDQKHLTRLREAIGSAKNTRSWLDAIEFILRLADTVNLEEAMALQAQYDARESYPWLGRRYDAGCAFMPGVLFDGRDGVFNGSLLANASPSGEEDAVQHGLIFDGSVTAMGNRYFHTNNGRKILFNTQEVEETGCFLVNEQVYRETVSTLAIYSGSFNADGGYLFGSNTGPFDNGGELNITIGRDFSGSLLFNAMSERFFVGNVDYDGSSAFYLDHKRKPRHDNAIVFNGDKMYMSGGECYANYQYSGEL